MIWYGDVLAEEEVFKGRNFEETGVAESATTPVELSTTIRSPIRLFED